MGASYTYNMTTDLAANLRQYLNSQPREQAFIDTPTLNMLHERDVKLGSAYIHVNVSYAGTAVGGPYVKNSAVSTEDVESATVAQFTPSFYAEPARISHIEEMQNRGPEKKFELWAHKVEQAKLRIRKKLATDLFATSQVSNGLTGLPLAIPGTNTSGTYGLNRATYTWWRNYSSTSVGAYTTYGVDAMDLMYIDILTKTGRKPDFYVTTPTIFQKMMKTARASALRFTPTYEGPYKKQLNDMAIEHISFAGSPVICDQYCDSGKVYAIRNDALYLGTFEKWDVAGPFPLEGSGVQGKVMFVRWGGQLLCEEQRALGQLSGLS